MENSSVQMLNLIEPFNDVYYINCYYSCLFSTIKYLGKDIKDLLVNTIYCYEVSQLYDKIIFSTEIGRKDEVAAQLKTMGIHATRKNEVDDVFESIQTAIDNKKPVIVFIDPYYLSYRKDTFRKFHSNHAVLICGYDNKNQKVHLIDQTNFLRLDYAKREVPYHEFAAAFDIVKEVIHQEPEQWDDKSTRLHSMKKWGIYCEFENMESVLRQDDNHISLYTTNIQNNIDSIHKGLNFIKEKLFNINPEETVHYINEIIHIKIAEKYTIERIIPVSERESLIYFINKVISLWKNMKCLQIRTARNPNVITNNKTILEQKMKLLFELETEWYRKLSNLDCTQAMFE